MFTISNFGSDLLMELLGGFKPLDWLIFLDLTGLVLSNQDEPLGR